MSFTSNTSAPAVSGRDDSSSTLTIAVPAGQQSEYCAAARRGALRFREDAPVLPPPAISPFKHRHTRLPNERDYSDRPYTRPFSRRESLNLQANPWDSHEQRFAPGSRRPAVAVSLIAIAASALSVVLVLRRPSSPDFTAFTSAADASVTADSASAAAAIAAALREFHASPSPAHKALHLHGGDSLLPVLEEYYAGKAPEPAFGTLYTQTANTVTSAEGTVAFGLYETADGEVRQYGAQLVDGRWLLDWRALTGWTGCDWRHFLEARPSGAHLFCVSAAPDDLYAGPFPSAEEWICLRVEDVQRDRPAWAYVRRDSKPGQLVAGTFLNGASPQRLTVKLRFPDAAQTDHGLQATAQLELTEVIRFGWFDPAPAAKNYR